MNPNSIKNKEIVMTSSYQLQPWTSNSFNSDFLKPNYTYAFSVEANIPKENILLSFNDKNTIMKLLSKLLNKTNIQKYYLNEKEWMIYLPTKKIKISKVKHFNMKRYKYYDNLFKKYDNLFKKKKK